MTYNQGKPKKKLQFKKPQRIEPIKSLLDVMEDGNEYESIVRHSSIDIDFAQELRRSINEIEAARQKPLVCLLSNVINGKIRENTGIDNTDDLPFTEMIAKIPDDVKDIDVMLVTPGGSAQQVARFVDTLRPRFDNVTFILPFMAMSAGTIFAMSGNEIIMNSSSFIGPIDPQVQNKNGRWLPAQAILTLVQEIQNRGVEMGKRGQNVPWTDLQILKNIDPKEIGNAINASNYSIELVETYLHQYKFKTWETHSSSDLPVTDDEKKTRAKEIAQHLCNHGVWKTHSRGIPRNIAWDLCKLKIQHSEDHPKFDKALRRFWALLYWVYGSSPVYKIFISKEYSIFRFDSSQRNITPK